MELKQDDDDVDAVYYAPGTRVLLNNRVFTRLHGAVPTQRHARMPALVLFTFYSPTAGSKYRHGVAVLTWDGKIEKWGTTWLQPA